MEKYDLIVIGSGAGMNVASNAAFQPVPFLTVYAATKAFVLSFTEGLAEELRGQPEAVVQAALGSPPQPDGSDQGPVVGADHDLESSICWPPVLWAVCLQEATVDLIELDRNRVHFLLGIHCGVGTAHSMC